MSYGSLPAGVGARRELEVVVVVGELDAGALADLAGAIVSLRDPFPGVGLLADRLVNPGIDQIPVANRSGVVDRRAPTRHR